MTSDGIIRALREQRLLFILRMEKTDHIAELVRTIWEAGGRFIEITLNTPEAISIISRLSSMVTANCYLGAGTVCSPADAEQAARAGASFVVSPVTSAALVQRVRELGLMSIIGAMTPSEIYNAFTLGADFVKVFPADSPDYIRSVRGPLGQVPLIAVGGVKKENAIKYFNAGCVAVAVGTSSLPLEPNGSFSPDEVRLAVRAMVRVCSVACGDNLTP